MSPAGGRPGSLSTLVFLKRHHKRLHESPSAQQHSNTKQQREVLRNTQMLQMLTVQWCSPPSACFTSSSPTSCSHSGRLLLQEHDITASARCGPLPLLGLVLLEDQDVGDGGTEPHLMEILLVCVAANCHGSMQLFVYKPCSVKDHLPGPAAPFSSC